MQVHLVDGTYELFRQYLAPRPGHRDAEGVEVGATRAVVGSVLGMLESGATHVGVASDHIVESFRNDLWDDYKTGDGLDPELFGQFEMMEEALEALGVAVWAMVELEADDAIAAAAASAAADARVEKVCIWTPDKDLAQCVRGDRVVQVDRKSKSIRNAAGVREKFGVDPEHIPDYLALTGDSADGYPGLSGIGAKTAARLINRYGALESFPLDVLGADRERALLFKRLATLRSDAPVLRDVDDLAWHGPTAAFAEFVERYKNARLGERAERAAGAAR